MKHCITIGFAALILAAAAPAAQAQYYGQPRSNSYGSYGTGSNTESHGVRGHIRSDGGYVEPYRATNPNSSQLDNYSTRGNVNPYTGQYGTRSPRY